MRRVVRAAGRAVLGAVVLVVVYGAVTLVQVVSASTHDERGRAQAIVVLGAAQYDGRPSPVFAARLDHAVALYADGVAPVVVVTGGKQEGDPGAQTEASAAADYLARAGVPESALRREVQGRTSYESLAATARFLRDEGISEVVLVSDPSHSYRIGDIADEVGLVATVSPTPASALSARQTVRQFARETLAVALGRVVSYRRLTWLEDRLDTAVTQVAR